MTLVNVDARSLIYIASQAGIGTSSSASFLAILNYDSWKVGSAALEFDTERDMSGCNRVEKFILCHHLQLLNGTLPNS